MTRMIMIMMIIIIVSKERDYVSELRPPKGLLVIPQATNGHGEPWWNTIGREN
jgi:hypothetical protein